MRNVDVKKAYSIIKNKNIGKRCIECKDYGAFFGFVFVSHKWDGTAFGGACDTVDKKTGAISTFSPFMDFELFDKAMPIALSALTD